MSAKTEALFEKWNGRWFETIVSLLNSSINLNWNYFSPHSYWFKFFSFNWKENIKIKLNQKSSILYFNDKSQKIMRTLFSLIVLKNRYSNWYALMLMSDQTWMRLNTVIIQISEYLESFLVETEVYTTPGPGKKIYW